MIKVPSDKERYELLNSYLHETLYRMGVYLRSIRSNTSYYGKDNKEILKIELEISPISNCTHIDIFPISEPFNKPIGGYKNINGVQEPHFATNCIEQVQLFIVGNTDYATSIQSAYLNSVRENTILKMIQEKIIKGEEI